MKSTKSRRWLGASLAAAVLVGIPWMGRATAAPAAAPIVIKVNNDSAPTAVKSVTWQQFKKYAEQKLGNKVDIQIYDNGSLYNQNDQLAALQQGNIQYIAPGSDVFGSLVPAVALFELPYLFKSAKMIRAAFYDKSIGGKVLSGMKDKNLIASSVWLNGWRMIGAKKPILTLGDLKGLKIRVPPGQDYVDTLKNLGANPVTIDWTECPQALQQGTIDGVEPTANQWYASKLYQIAPEITYSDHIYSLYIVATNKTWWSSLPKNIRTGLTWAMKKAQQWNFAHVASDNNNDVKLMEQGGAHFHKLSTKTLNQWRKATAPVWQESKNIVGAGILKKVEKMRSKYKWDTTG